MATAERIIYQEGTCEVCWHEGVDRVPPAWRRVTLSNAFYSIEDREWQLCPMHYNQVLMAAVERVGKAHAHLERCKAAVREAKEHSRTFLRKPWDDARRAALSREVNVGLARDAAKSGLKNAVAALAALPAHCQPDEG